MGLNSVPGPVLLPSPDRHSYKILEPEINRNHDRLGGGRMKGNSLTLSTALGTFRRHH